MVVISSGLPHGASDLAKALPTQFVPELLAARQSVQHSVAGMFHLTTILHLTVFRFVIKSTCGVFKHWCAFLSRKDIIQWNIAPASRERKLSFQYLTYVSTSISCIKNRQLDFRTIYRNWPATYVLYIHQSICKLNECIKLTFVRQA